MCVCVCVNRILSEHPIAVCGIASDLVRRLSHFVKQMDFALDWMDLEAGKALYRYTYLIRFWEFLSCSKIGQKSLYKDFGQISPKLKRRQFFNFITFSDTY